jgi:hypothetical protein
VHQALRTGRFGLLRPGAFAHTLRAVLDRHHRQETVKPPPLRAVLDRHHRQETVKPPRQIVEQAFGILKCRWRLLLKTQEVSKQQNLQLLVMACCTLHNMCVEDRVPFDAAMIDDQAKE